MQCGVIDPRNPYYKNWIWLKQHPNMLVSSSFFAMGDKDIKHKIPRDDYFKAYPRYKD